MKLAHKWLTWHQAVEGNNDNKYRQLLRLQMSVSLDISGLRSGIYFVRMDSEGFSDTQKYVLTR